MKSSFTVGCKLKIIKYAEMHGNAEAAEKFKVDLRRVGEWKKKKDDLSSANRKKRSLNMSPPKWPELEKLLQEWVIGQRTAGRAVNTDDSGGGSCYCCKTWASRVCWYKTLVPFIHEKSRFKCPLPYKRGSTFASRSSAKDR